MEIWRVGYGEEKLPAVVSRRTLTVALLLHLSVFVIFWLYAACHDLFHKDEEIIPIDLTVVVNENLDGKPDEPPPLKNPEPPKPKPKPQPKKVKEPEKPKELEKIVTNIVTKVDKKIEKKEPEKPKKSAKELREERLKRMRESAKVVNKPVKIEVRNAPSGDGRTDRQNMSKAEIEKLLGVGVKPGTSNQLAASDEQLGFSLIKMTVESKWETPPWTDTLKPMTVRIWFGGGGRVVSYKLERSSGDAKADRSILSAASRVGAIPGLPPAFIEAYKNKGIPCQFTVRPH